MIRFSAALVVVAVVVLISGIASSVLLLVYMAIILSAAALIMLAVGVALKRDEVFGETGQSAAGMMGTGASQSSSAGSVGQTSVFPAAGNVRSGSAFTSQPAFPATQFPTPATQFPAPAPADSVSETRTDLTAVGTEPGQTSEAEETRFDLSPVTADETRFDLTPVTQDPAASEETSLDLPAVSADDTSLDLPIQPEAAPAAPAAPEAPEEPEAAEAPGEPEASHEPEAPETPAKEAEAAEPKAESPPKKTVSGDSQVAVIPGVPRFHAPNCILIRFMDESDLERMTLDEAQESGFTACTACQADTGSFRAVD